MDPAPSFPCVRPRARRVDAPGVEAQLLEDQVRALIDEGARGLVWIGGPPGAGKSTALRLLERRFADRGAVFLDDPHPKALAARPDQLRIYAASASLAGTHLLRLELEPWGPDDLLELLLACARERCGALYPALCADPFGKELGGLPELWSAVVSACLEGSAPVVSRALRAYLRRTLGSRPRRRLTGAAALAHLKYDDHVLFRLRRRIARRHGEAPGDRLFRQKVVRVLLASDHLAARLRAGRVGRVLSTPLPSVVIELAGPRLGRSSRARSSLEGLLDAGQAATMAASLLHAGDPRWLGGVLARRGDAPLKLGAARLRGVHLAGAKAVELRLRLARLQRSDWTNAAIGRLFAGRANFARAKLSGAEMEVLYAPGAVFTGADMTRIRCEEARLDGADLTRARARGARLTCADLSNAVLTRADLREAVLDGAILEGARVGELRLAGASLTQAKLRDLDLRTADLRGADLSGADLTRANLEGLDLPGAQLARALLLGAYLTASHMPGAKLHGAFLNGAGLAEVSWEGADLTRADFSRASFHLGSSRSGLVGGYPSQGTRTGFYTDARQDLLSLPPEQVRKANLCRADLRRAKVVGADFYLVDLRGALYTPEQERHFRATGAILGDL